MEVTREMLCLGEKLKSEKFEEERKEMRERH